MKTTKVKFASIEAYIATFPQEVQERLEQMRAAVKAAAPKAEEAISYHMPAFTLDGNYVAHFSAYKSHIGLYGMAYTTPAIKKAIVPYSGPKGALRFPFDQPLPVRLIKQLVKVRVAENKKSAKLKAGKKK
jgi:uncharacterized protein YdhG (YjbR/CyaY superfamily)